MPSDLTTYLLFNNNLVSADSLEQSVDSIKATMQPIVVAFDGISHPSLPQTESWVFGVLFGLFFLLILAVRLYPSLIYEDIRSFFRVKERSSIFSNLEGRDSRLRVLYISFAFCVISLCVYFIIFKPEYGNFVFMKYLCFLAVTTVFFLLKSLFIRILNYVFFDKKMMKIAIQSHYSLVVFLGLSLFPLLILGIYASPPTVVVVQIATVIVCFMTMILVLLKLFQLFFSKLLDSFYIMLYLCTLEILPFFALFHVCKMIV